MPASAREAIRVRLKPADPFDLIRHLARSQNDPRKAVAELVQNSLDAGAAETTVTRYRRSGLLCLSVVDNGQGVLPSMERRDALRYIAEHIGQSVKRKLSAEERFRLMQLGKYGIGLLGFWSVGRFLTIRSRVGSSEVFALHLEEDKPDATVRLERGQKLLAPTWTEVIIQDLHPAAMRLLSGRKLAEYLGGELRGQLAQREVRLRVVDRVARGRAQKDFPVRPARFLGVPLSEIREWPVPGQSPLRIEIHYLPEEHGDGRVALACGGTTVCDDLSLLEAVDLRHHPWNSGRLTGIVDAPFLDVAPGTRRGIVPNEKADAFLEAMRGLTERVASWLQTFDRARASEADQQVHRRLRQVFGELGRRLPKYELFPEPAGIGPGVEADAVGPAAEEPTAAASEEHETAPELPLIPPGPLESVRIVPASCKLLVGAEKTLVAKAFDATGRPIREGVDWTWKLPDGPGSLRTKGSEAVFTSDVPGTARISAEARQREQSATAEAAVEVVEHLEISGHEGSGVPEPLEVKDPLGAWRSRLRDGRWEFNGSHPDYLLAAPDPARRFRYLATLFAKEVVVRQVAGSVAEDRLLESLVEILTAIEDRLGRPGRRPK